MNVNDILSFIEPIDGFIRLKLINYEFVNYVFASADQIIAISNFEDSKSLETHWEQAVIELAVNVQSRLEGDYDSLRWDVYMLFNIEDGVAPLELAVRIENDRRFFRKIIIDSSKSIEHSKLPILFLHATDNENGNYLFNNADFMEQLGNSLQGNARNLLSPLFYFKGEIDSKILTQFMLELKI